MHETEPKNHNDTLPDEITRAFRLKQKFTTLSKEQMSYIQPEFSLPDPHIIYHRKLASGLLELIILTNYDVVTMEYNPKIKFDPEAPIFMKIVNRRPYPLGILKEMNCPEDYFRGF